ncbi:hypothetical protein HDU93_002724, partial [Gonapodya sp. JEL0774]
MAGSILWLSILSLGMLFGAFFAGQIPLSMSLSGDRLRLLNTLGAGLTVGAALIVIIPEGVETLYSAQLMASTSTVTVHKRALVESSFVARCTGPSCARLVERLSKRAEGYDSVFDLLPGATEVAPPVGNGALEESELEHEPEITIGNHTEEHHVHSHSMSAHTYIGPSLAMGFAVMLVIDQMFKARPNHEHKVITLSDFRARPPTPTNSGASNSYMGRSNAFATTLGMVVHAAADGVALGASSAVSTSLEIVVFVAIIVHKAPSAFGLATHLLNEGLSR